MGAYSRNKGSVAERDVAKFLRQWWPGSCRAVRTGSSAAPDPGDIANGPPGVIISVKDAPTRSSFPADWVKWWQEVDAMLEADPAAMGVIVEKRTRTSDVGAWWCHMRLGDLVALYAGSQVKSTGDRAPARITVQIWTELLISAGYARDLVS